MARQTVAKLEKENEASGDAAAVRAAEAVKRLGGDDHEAAHTAAIVAAKWTLRDGYKPGNITYSIVWTKTPEN